MKKAALFAGVIAALICGTTLAAVISGVSAGSGSVYPTPVPAQYVAASYGSGLANESIAAGTDSALYCAMDNLDGTTSTPECGLNAIRHKGVGPFSDANYLSLGTGSDVFDFAGDFHGAIVLRPTSLAAEQYLLANNTGTAGWALYIAAGGIPVLRIDGPGGSQYVVAGTGALVAHNTYVITFGRIGTTGHISVNGAATTTLAVETHAPATGTVMYLGRYVSAGAAATAVYIQELSLSNGTTTAAALAVRGTATMDCRNIGRCIPTSADEVAYFGGDDYTIGGSWCGDYPTCSAAKTFTRTGTVTTREARYSWPALTPTQNGTVPRVATSGLYPQGYGARHASLGPFSAANYVSLGSGVVPDVLDFSDDFTECAIVEPTPTDFSGYASIISNTNVTTRGYELFASADFTLRARFLLPGVADAVSSVVTPNSTVAVCWGRQGTTGRIQVGSGTTGTVVTTGYLPASSAPALIGDNAARPAFAGKVHEIFATTTPASEAYLTYLTDAAMRCTTQGNCFPRDANTVMHCNGDEFTGSVLRCGVNTGADPWTTNGTVTLNTPDFYRNVDAQRISAPGAGPYSAANFFQWGTTTDVLDFSGSWTVCSSFDVTTSGGQVINGGYDAGTLTGWAMNYVSGKLQCTVATVLGGAVSVDTSTNAGSDGSLNIGCCGWTRGSNIVSARLNASAIATQGGASFTPATTIPSYIGRRNAAGTELGGRVYEILALNKAPTTELLDTIHRRWLNHQSLTGQALSNTHTADRTLYTSGGVAIGAAPQAVRIAPPTLYRTVPANAGDAGTTVTPLATPGGYIATPAASVKTQWPVVTTGWYTAGMTVTPNAGLAPDGTMTAMTVRETTANSSHMLFAVSNDPGVSDGYRTGSFFIRPYPLAWDGCLYITHYLNRSDTANDREYVGIDLRDLSRMRFGIVGPTITSSEGAGYEILKDGWLRVWFSVQAPTASAWYPALSMRMHHPAGDCFSGSYTYVGDPNYGFDLWYWHELLGVGPQVMGRPASSGSTALSSDTIAASNPLRPNGSDWTNLLLQSEDLATTWAGLGNPATVTIAANSAMAPDGSFTADKVTVSAPVDAAGEYAVVRQNPLTGAAAGSASAGVWVKAGTGISQIYLNVYDGGSWIIKTPCTLTSEWTLCYGSGTAAGVWYVDIGANNNIAPGQTMSAGTFYLWGGQAENSSTLHSYCPTTTTARTCGPGGATGKVITNLIKYSDAWDNATAWSPAVVAVTGDDRPGRAPGTFGDTITVLSDGSARAVGQTFTAAASRYTVSFWIQAGSVSSGMFGLYQSGWVGQTAEVVEGPGTITGSTPISITGLSATEWTRVKTTTNAALVAGNATLYVYPRNAGPQTTGDSVGVQDAQLEESPAAGPYCGPTAATSRTCAPKQRWCVRAKDVTPGYGRRWTMTTGTVIAAGGAYNGANSWNVQAYGTKIYLDSRGADSGVALSMNADHTFAAGSTHTIVACVNDGAGAIYYDGSFTPAGTGTVATFSNWSTAVTLGSVAAGVYSWGGTIGSLEFNSTGDPRDFVWDQRTP